ncbi:hypothetical protein Tco_0444939 [Tanacetum coccineum]
MRNPSSASACSGSRRKRMRLKLRKPFRSTQNPCGKHHPPLPPEDYSTIPDDIGDLSSQISRKVMEIIGPQHALIMCHEVRNIVIRVSTGSHHLNDREND